MGCAREARAEILRNQDRAFMTARPKRRAKTPASSPTSLKRYQDKRDFSRTSEPKPEPRPQRSETAGLQFVVQKHAARRVHYDLRLELDGVLKSWAVTRGPSLVLGEKRLAVHTEDHPIDYLTFEGNIPRGEYGAGAMIVWDHGCWEPVGDPRKALQKGHLEFELAGHRLKGRWHLVRIRPKPGEKTDPWLLIKAEDAFARGAADPAITDEETTSFLTGRTTEELAAAGELRVDHAGRAKVAASRKPLAPLVEDLRGARKGLLPAFLEPSQAQSAERPPSGSKWVHEIKYDGYRIQTRIDGSTVKLLTRKGLDWTARFPRLVVSLRRLELASAWIDGEIVVEDLGGIPNFNLLQADLSEGREDRLRYFVFDLLYCEGFDLTKATLVDRKGLLEKMVADRGRGLPLRYSEHLAQDGPVMFEHACRLGLEGILSKRADLPYRPGRGDHWIKTKSILRQEFVIVGYIPSTAETKSVGSLQLGYYRDGKLLYAGGVGTGYSVQQARSLRDELEKLHVGKPQFGRPLPEGLDKTIRWVAPKLVCEVEFSSFSADDLLRQGSFKGLREDRAPEEVEREPAATRMARSASRSEPNQARARAGIRLTHPERILWPDYGVTKQGLAEFYVAIADWILPHLKDRVLSLVRCPSGVAAKCFYAKHAWAGISDAVRRVDVGEKEPMLILDDLAGLITLVQAGVIEIHPWGSTFAHLETPDRLIFDLDPGEDVPWSAVTDAALDVRVRLDDIGLKSFVKTSGGKGLHVVVPITPSVGWDEAKEFTKSIADAMARDKPDRYLAVMSKSARRGRVFVDYLRNGRGATAVGPYSPRALPQASVSVPLDWSELSGGLRADHFKIDNLRQRLDNLRRDPWQDIGLIRQKLPPSRSPPTQSGRRTRVR
jgi:bifunctional non-homologous end joining protein LigD